jgi:hypothetical protein
VAKFAESPSHSSAPEFQRHRTTSAGGNPPESFAGYLAGRLLQSNLSKQRISILLSALLPILLIWSQEAKIDLTLAGAKLDIPVGQAREIFVVILAVILARLTEAMAEGAHLAASLRAELGTSLSSDDKVIASVKTGDTYDLRDIFERSELSKLAYYVFWLARITEQFLYYAYGLAVAAASFYFVGHGVWQLYKAPRLSAPLSYAALFVACIFLAVSVLSMIQYWIVRRVDRPTD